MGRLAAQQPVLLIVEDLHWVDPSTLELLALLLDQVPTLRLYIVLTCRPEFQPPWGFRTHLTPLVLTRLTPAQAEAMVQGMLGGHRLPAAVLAQIVAQTDGIPLFVEEVTKAVRGGGLSTAGPAPDAVTGPGPALAIPVTLHEALMARLDRLGSAKGVAQLGATLGREFPYALLRAVAPLEDEALQRDLATLVAAELLYQRGQPPQAIYTFKHALIQEAAYESVLRSVRRQTHQRIVQVLEAQFPETAVTPPALLAHHALRGEQWDQAVTSFRQAGEQALARSAYREAVAAFEQALEAVPHLPESRETRRPLISASRCATPSGPWGAQADLRLLTGGRGPCRDPGRPHIAWGGSRRICSPILCRQANWTAPSSRPARPGIATALGDIGLTVAAQHYLGHAYRSLGDYHQAMECYRKNVACLHGPPARRFGLPGWPPWCPTVASPPVLPSAASSLRGGLLQRKGCGLPKLPIIPIAVSWRIVAWAFGRCGREISAQAIPMLERALDLAQGVHFRLGVPRIAALLGAAYTLAGRTTEALPLLEQAVEQAVAMHFMSDMRPGVWLGEAYLRAGRLDEAGLRRSGPWSSPGPIRNGVTKPTPCGSLARLQRSESRRRLSRLKRTTSRPSPWPRHWACVRFSPLPPWARHVVSPGGTARAGPGCPGHGHRAVPGHGDDLLAAPDRGGAGANRGKTSVSQVTIHSSMAARSPGLSCDSKSGASTWVHASPWRLRAPASGNRIQPLTDTQQRQRSARPSSRRARCV